MRAFKTRTFNRWAAREGLSDRELRRAVTEIQAGLIDASLGGGLFKKRIRRAGKGKRGGYRVLLASNLRERLFFVAGFAKSERDNIGSEEIDLWKRAGAAFLSMSAEMIKEALDQKKLVEIDHDDQKTA